MLLCFRSKFSDMILFSERFALKSLAISLDHKTLKLKLTGHIAYIMFYKIC